MQAQRIAVRRQHLSIRSRYALPDFSHLGSHHVGPGTDTEITSGVILGVIQTQSLGGNLCVRDPEDSSGSVLSWARPALVVRG